MDYLPAETDSTSQLPTTEDLPNRHLPSAYDYAEIPVRISPHPLPRGTNPAFRHLRSQEAKVSVASKRSQLNRVALILGAPEPERLVVDGDKRKVHPSQTFPMDYVFWEDLTADRVSEVLAQLRDQGLSPASRNAYRSLLRGVAREARLLKKMTHEDVQLINEVKGARFHRIPGGKAHAEGVIETMLSVCDQSDTAINARDGLMIALLATTGLRRAELVGVRLEDLSLDSHEVKVTGKGNKDRVLVIPDGVWDRLVDYLERYRGYEPGFLFTPVWNNRAEPSLKDGALSTTSINRRIDAIRRRAEGLLGTNIAPHDLRRTFATDLYNAGMTIREIQILLGHASAATTEAYLFDESSEYRKKAATINANRFKMPSLSPTPNKG